MNDHRYSEPEIDALWRVLRERRDMRHFVAGQPLPDGCLERLIDAAHLAPSVGYMQPWRFLRITDPALRRGIQTLVEAERLKTADALPSRRDEFLGVKIEGLADCAEVLVVTLMPGRDKHIVGRRTLPQMDIASVGCAIQNMWLAARAEGIGLGWVSIFEPNELKQVFRMPDDAQPIAILCIGPVAEFPQKPLLESQGWGARLPLEQVVFADVWPADAEPTPTAY